MESLAFYCNSRFIVVDFILFLTALKLLLSISFVFTALVCLASGSTIKVFTANDGLPSSYVFTAFQDRSGYIWAGTYGGLSRFDGRNFVNFTVTEGLGSNQILKIMQDKKNNIIAGSFFGVSIYDGVKFRNIEKISGVSIERTRTLIEDKHGNLWGGCRNGLWKMEASGKMQLFSKDQQQAKEKAEAEARALEAQRQANLKRMAGLAGGTGAPDSTGTAARASGPSASYAGRVIGRVKPNIVFPDEISGNPVAVVEVRTAPDGTIVGKRLIKPSGNKAWDDAVLKALDKTETLPRDEGRPPPSPMEISFRPRD